MSNPGSHKIITEHCNHSENTMNYYIISSAAILLAKLRIKYSQATRALNMCQSLEAKGEHVQLVYLEKMRDAIKANPDHNQDKPGCQEVYDFMARKFQEAASSNLDEYSYTDEYGKKQAVNMLICEVFLYVYLELMSGLTSEADIDQSKTIQNRYEHLYLCCKGLLKGELAPDREQGRCHTGVRHELVMALCGYSKLADEILITVPLEVFLEQKASAFIVELFQKKTSSEQMQYILGSIACSSASSGFLDEVSPEQLKKCLTNACINSGINLDYAQTAINSVLSGFKKNKDFFLASPEISQQVYFFNDLDMLVKQQTTEALKAQEIFAECKTYADVMDKGLIALLETNKIEKYLQEILPIIKYYPNEARLMGEAQKYLQLISDYKENFITSKLSASDFNQAMTEHQEAVGELKKQIEEFKSAYACSDVAEFFALYNSASTANNKGERRQKITDKLYLIFENDESFIQEFFKFTIANEVSLSPFQINRILLHAIMMPLNKQWSENFRECFGAVLKFLEKLGSNSEANVAELRKTSYPDRLLFLLKVLSGDKHIGSSDDLGQLLCLLPPYNQRMILQRLSENHELLDILSGEADICCFLEEIPDCDKLSTLETLANELHEIFSNSKNIRELLKQLPSSDQLSFWEILNRKGYLNSIIKNPKDAGFLLNAVPIECRLAFIEYLRSNADIKAIIDDRNNIKLILRSLSPSDQKHLIESLRLSIDDLVSTGFELADYLELAPKAERLAVLARMLDANKLNTMPELGTILDSIFSKLAEQDQVMFLELLEQNNALKDILKNIPSEYNKHKEHYFYKFLTTLPQYKRLEVIRKIYPGEELKNLIKDSKILYNILSSLFLLSVTPDVVQIYIRDFLDDLIRLENDGIMDLITDSAGVQEIVSMVAESKGGEYAIEMLNYLNKNAKLKSIFITKEGIIYNKALTDLTIIIRKIPAKDRLNIVINGALKETFSALINIPISSRDMSEIIKVLEPRDRKEFLLKSIEWLDASCKSETALILQDWLSELRLTPADQEEVLQVMEGRKNIEQNVLLTQQCTMK